MIIEVITPSTFFSPEKDLRILDDKGNIFYYHPNKEGSITFNLPKGKYSTKNKIIKEEVFKPYEKFNPPFPKGFLKGLEIIVKPNPCKASIYRKEKYIVIDPKIANHEYKGVPAFTIAHEIGHFIHFPKNFNDHIEREAVERGADAFAVNYMLGNGWNPSQIKLAKELCLGHVLRKLCLDSLTTDERNQYRR